MSDANGAGKVVQSFSLDPEVLETLKKTAGREPISSYVNRLLREHLGLPAN